MKKDFKKPITILLLGIALALGGCKWRFDTAFCNHDYQTVTIAPTCQNRGYTAEMCTLCGYEQGACDFVPKWEKHLGLGACDGCKKDFGVLFAEDVAKDGQDQGDAYVYNQGVVEGEYFVLTRKKSHEKVQLYYVCGEVEITFLIGLLSDGYSCVYKIGEMELTERIDPREISALGVENTMLENMALKAARAVEQYYLYGKQYSMKNLGFTSL